MVTLKLNLSPRDYAHLCPKAASSFWTLNMVRLDPSKLNVTGYQMAHAAAPRKIGLPLAEVKHGCQMALARFLDRMCLALRASGLWLRYARTLRCKI